MRERLYFPYYSNKEEISVDIKDIKLIYANLKDELSRNVFMNRLMFSCTNDWRYIRELIEKLDAWKRLDQILASKTIYIYGAGVRGERFPLLFPEYRVDGYIDERKAGEMCNGLPVFGLEKCLSFNEDKTVILVTNLVDYDKIKQKLVKYGYKDDSIIVMEEYYQQAAENMYFDSECIKREDVQNKAFIDAGCFDGNDTKRFYKWIGDIFAKSICFEIDRQNCENCKKNLESYKQVDLYNLGLSGAARDFKIAAGKRSETSLSREGDTEIKTVTLDEIIGNREVGYIKMDIEGAEGEALMGAKRLIKSQAPMLAVSLYHKREDIWEIPSLILKLNPNYKFYLRHYSLSIAETVLYAV